MCCHKIKRTINHLITDNYSKQKQHAVNELKAMKWNSVSDIGCIDKVA